MLHKFHITAAVQVVATASISIVPFIFKIVTWNDSNEQTKDVWKEELKLNVKHMVKKLTVNDRELGKTFLIQSKVVKNKKTIERCFCKVLRKRSPSKQKRSV